MPYWLTNPDHGTMPVYDMGEVERVKKFGWTLLNVGESPALPVVNGDTAREQEDVIEEQHKVDQDAASKAWGQAHDEAIARIAERSRSDAEQAAKEALAESMRLDPPPRRKPGRPPKAK
jgi:hypothetical protein